MYCGKRVFSMGEKYLKCSMTMINVKRMTEMLHAIKSGVSPFFLFMTRMTHPDLILI
jgi:hypothetical protein